MRSGEQRKTRGERDVVPLQRGSQGHVIGASHATTPPRGVLLTAEKRKLACHDGCDGRRYQSSEFARGVFPDTF